MNGWKSLLFWLASHGMTVDSLIVEPRKSAGAGFGLYAAQDCLPDSTLMEIPATALLNLRTLSSHYPNQTLSAIQLISTHLALWRPRNNMTSTDSLFGPYIDILPLDFDFHPLVWQIKNPERVLSLPPGVKNALIELEERFRDDWDAVKEYSVRGEVNYDDFLWAWLNVNTRCIYCDLGLSSSDNLTLCPIVDFANHSIQPHASPFPVRRNGAFVLNSICAVQADEEIYFQYGAHPNWKLFVEYGFTTDTASLEVDVQDLVESLEQSHAEEYKMLLEKERYWGEWTIHSIEGSGYPSYRLITALRLYHSRKDIGAWQEAMLGIRPVVSIENEHAWRKSLGEMCDKLIVRAEENEGKNSGCCAALWREERIVAKDTLESLYNNVQF